MNRVQELKIRKILNDLMVIGYNFHYKDADELLEIESDEIFVDDALKGIKQILQENNND